MVMTSDTQKNILVKNADGTTARVHVPSFFATYCDATQVICVSATRQNDVPASYTNFGRSAIYGERRALNSSSL